MDEKVTTPQDYSLIFIFRNNMQDVLLVKKNRGPYPYKLNGIGGKVEDSDRGSIKFCAMREIIEETGIIPEYYDKFGLQTLMTLSFPGTTYSKMTVYYTLLNDGVNFTQIEDEPLRWYWVLDVLEMDENMVAGESGILYFLKSILSNYKIINPLDDK